MNRFRISSILFILALLISAFTSCAKQEAPQSDPAPETDQTQTDPQPGEQTDSAGGFSYAFDTETPKVIDLSLFANADTAFGGPDLRMEFFPAESGGQTIPETLSVYQLPVYPEHYEVLSEEQMTFSEENLSRYVSLYSGKGERKAYTGKLGSATVKGELVTNKDMGWCDAVELDGVGILSYPNEILLEDISSSLAIAREQKIPTREEILGELEQNEYLKAACAFLEITDPDVMIEVYHFGLGEDQSADWMARVFQKADNLENMIYARSFRSIELHGFALHDPVYDENGSESRQAPQMVYRVSISTLLPELVQERVPIISMEDALKEVQSGYYLKSGALFSSGRLINDSENCDSVKMRYGTISEQNDERRGIQIPCYEFYFPCADHTKLAPSQTMLILPACNLYLKPAE